MKLLLVEDENELTSSICKYLTREGYLIDSASTYNEGRDRILLFDYDCAIIDITLPGGNGLDLISLIKVKFCPCPHYRLMRCQLNTLPWSDIYR